ncbi:MAG TPA: glycosyltransferase family 2 protein [Chthonomonadales bacterium]|nr:glycosyltransferase family 2 protein [Chthonomonadales bacterium]
MKIAAILPAYNEAERVASVVRAVKSCPAVHQVIVVDDGSTDGTGDAARRAGALRVIDLPENRGKGAAMLAGATATDADVLLFLDADLIGLQARHIDDMLTPIRQGRARMTVGRFRGGRKITDWSQRLVPSISGQRAICRDVFDTIPDIAGTRYGVEMAITRFCRYYRVPTVSVLLPGITHPMKEEKLGLLRGWVARVRMYLEILRIVLDPRPPHTQAPRRRRLSVPTLLRRLAAPRRRESHRHTAAQSWRREPERTGRGRGAPRANP